MGGYGRFGRRHVVYGILDVFGIRRVGVVVEEFGAELEVVVLKR